MAGGAGSSAAGAVAAGTTPTSAEGSIKVAIPERYVPRFDLATRQFIRDDEGRLRVIHWVDQATALALGVPKKAHESNPSLGNTLRDIKRNDPNKINAEVRDSVDTALKPLVDGKHIQVVRTAIATNIRGRTIIEVDYINRRKYLDPKTAITENSNAGGGGSAPSIADLLLTEGGELIVTESNEEVET